MTTHSETDLKITILIASILLMASCTSRDLCGQCDEQSITQSITANTDSYDSYGNDCSKLGLTSLPSPLTHDYRCQFDAAHPWKQP